ncbi:MAG: helix-turn-helix domain-containing protein [Pseudomonadota bacterium]
MSASADLPPKKLLFRPTEVAEMLGVSPRTVQRYMNAGDFGELWIRGRRRCIFRQNLVAFLQSTSPPEEE